MMLAEDSSEPLGVRATAAELAVRLGDRGGLVVLASLVTVPSHPCPSSYRRWVLRLIREFEGVEVIPVLEQARSDSGLIARYQLARTVRKLSRGQRDPLE